MPSVYLTNNYELNLYYEPTEPDTPPTLSAYKVWRDEHGYWNADSSKPDAIYRFDEEDMAYGRKHKFEYITDKDWGIDEYFWNYEIPIDKTLPPLPPKALEWLQKLPTYEYNDYASDN